MKILSESGRCLGRQQMGCGEDGRSGSVLVDEVKEVKEVKEAEVCRVGKCGRVAVILSERKWSNRPSHLCVGGDVNGGNG
jgi:hypothetical protein